MKFARWIKANRGFVIFCFIFLFVVILVLLFHAIDNSSTKSGENLGNVIDDSFQNIQELHWTHMPLTYKIANPSECSSTQIKKFKLATEIIENSTDNLIQFEEREDNVDIIVSCKDIYEAVEESMAPAREASGNVICINVTYNSSVEDISPYSEEILDSSTQNIVEYKIVNKTPTENIWQICYYNLPERPENYVSGIELGVGGPDEIIENKILNASVLLYRDDYYQFTGFIPTTEIHEILHSFGLSHSYNTTSIMYPELTLDVQKLKNIDESIISCLKKMYSNGNINGTCSDVNMFEYSEKCGEGYCLEGDACKDGKCYTCGIGYTMDVENWSCIPV